MNNKELPSDSDTSDEDFLPDGADKEVSEESDSNCVESGGEDNADKRKKSNERKKSRKRLKPLEEKENEEKQEPVAALTTEEKKKRSDAIWADFLKDCGPSVKKRTADDDSNGKEEVEERATASLPTPVRKVTQLFEFAGEKVEVEREIPEANASQAMGGAGRRTSVGPGKSGGIAAVLGQLGKKGKLSTLEKSKLDWEKFKKEEDIGEELQRFNKGKQGYLERQEFLERADLRQFEIEKDLRTKRRTLNR